jgi:NRPS condensation-like uncharacterized protein
MTNTIHKERIYLHSPAANVIMAFSIRGDIDLDRLSNAIREESARHGILSSRIEQTENGDAFYRPQSLASLQITVCDNKNWRDVLHENEKLPYAINSGDLIHHVLVKRQDGVDWILASHHLAGDGLSCLFFFRDVMNALCGTDEAVKRLLPVRIHQKEDLPEGVKLAPFYKLMVRMLNRQWEKGKKVFSWEDRCRLHESFWANRRTEVLDEDIKGEQLDHLLELCHQNHVTLTAAMVTALLANTPGEYDAGLAASIRPQGFEDMGNYASGISVRVKLDDKRSFWENASFVQKSMKSKLDCPKRKYFILCFMDALSPTLIDAAYYSAYMKFENKAAARMSTMLGYRNNAKGISLTNLTRAPIPEKYGEYILERIVFAPPLVPNAKRILGAVTIGNTMTVTMQYCTDRKENKKLFVRAMALLSSL